MIIPSIDLMNGKAVQLLQGKEKILERSDVIDLALNFRRYGEIAVIDLDAAFGNGDNIELIKQICKIADCRVGGGIRTIEKANEILQAGAKKIIIGTKAIPKFLKQLPKERVIAAIDAKDGYVVNNGWRSKTNKTPKKLIMELEPFCSEFLFTDVNKEGLMKGIDFSRIKRLRESTKNRLTVAGGITYLSEIKWLENLGIDSQLGMSLYTGKIKLSDAFISIIDFGKNNGLVPTIVQDDKKQVLMLAFSNKESLSKTLENGKAAYYSRSRKKIWAKGETSGNYQEILRVKYDCDRDTLLFIVKQKSFACHQGAYSCFGSQEFDFDVLFEVIRSRINNPNEDSYTSKISRDERKIRAKIKEEAEELANYNGKPNLIWEAADLLYFMFVLLAKNNVNINDLRNELWRRRK